MAAIAYMLREGTGAVQSLGGNAVSAHWIVRSMADPTSIAEAQAAGLPKIGDPWPMSPLRNAICRSVELVRIISPSASMWRTEYAAGGLWPSIIRISAASVEIGKVEAYSAVALSAPSTPWVTLWRKVSFDRQRGVHRMVEVRDIYVEPAMFHSAMARNLLAVYSLPSQGFVPCLLAGASWRRDAGNNVRIETHFITTAPLPAIQPVSGVYDIAVPGLGPLDEYAYREPAWPSPPECVVIPAQTLYAAGEPLPWIA